ncbi:MAG: DegT/DnrJ/EryC1/StrS family aminotransferase [Ktedonobacteraceae bacterium]|nr:DegT/DnrJ/EryC1/StrS family aminotransferase [Ktedonobacteraceae bacterium]
MSELALLGGPMVRTKLFPAYRTIGKEEEVAVLDVLRSGVLSRFVGSWHPDFYGGPQIRALEEEWAKQFGVKHAITVNSATSGLYCAVGAIGAGPGDEIIVSPYSMSVSATAPLIFKAIPVFADIEEDYFCLSAESIEEQITEATRAIIVVDLFGQPYDADRINAIAKKHNLWVIEDAAQAPYARYKDRFAGTLGDIGIYSLNYHKHIHAGEGGMIVTDNDDLADKMRLIRNHAEAVVEGKGVTDIVNMVGFNFRMTEIEAAITREQLKKLPSLVKQRQENVSYLAGKLSEIPCLEPAKVRPGCEHAFYMHILKFDSEIAGVHRNRFVEAVRAELPAIELRETEGVKVVGGYVKPLYLQPMFQQKIAYGKEGYPFKGGHAFRDVCYDRGICPVCERMHFDELINHELMRPGMSQQDMDDVFAAFAKVWENRSEL